jgi:hypothetical protein
MEFGTDDPIHQYGVNKNSIKCMDCVFFFVLFNQRCRNESSILSVLIDSQTPFGLNLRSCLLSESGNATFRSHVQTTCISNWLIWKQKVCKTFLGSSRNISIIIVTKNSDQLLLTNAAWFDTDFNWNNLYRDIYLDIWTYNPKTLRSMYIAKKCKL